MIKLIIFDWDDVFTLGATQGYYACYHEALLKVGVSLTVEEEKTRIDRKWGSTAEVEIAELLQEKPELVAEAVKKYHDALFGQTFVQHLKIVPGAPELLEQLSKNYRLAIATGLHPKLLIERIMPAFNVKNVFAQIESVYDLPDSHLAKPNPFLVNKILSQQGVGPAETIVVGDASNDMKMAQAAHVESVAVLTGHMNRSDAESLNIKYIIPSVVELPSILQII